MAYEPAVIEQWIYETLSGDATLSGLLAVDNKPDGYQMGIYNTVAPQISLPWQTRPPPKQAPP